MSGVLRQSQGQHWQCNLTTNRERISSLVSSGHLSDVTLVFSDNRRIQAHKLILAMSSPVFEAMMYGAMATNEITLACDSYEMFQLLLCYIYEEEINLSDVFVGIQMYHLAHRYQMDTLALYCSKYLMGEVTPATLPLVYDTALLLEDFLLLHHCTEVLVMAADNVLESPEIIFMRRSSLWQLLTNPRLCVSSRIIIFKAITAWGVENAGYHPHPAETGLALTPLENARRNRSSNSRHAGQSGSVLHNGAERLDSFKPATSELKKTVEEFLPLVRFDEMSVEELVTWVFPSGIFTGDECVALVMNVKGIHTSALPASISQTENIGRKRMQRSTTLLSLNSTNGSSIGYIYYDKVNVNLLQNILINKSISLLGVSATCLISLLDGTLTIFDSANEVIERGVWQGTSCSFRRPVRLLPTKSYKIVLTNSNALCAYHINTFVSEIQDGVSFSGQTTCNGKIVLTYLTDAAHEE